MMEKLPAADVQITTKLSHRFLRLSARGIELGGYAFCPTNVPANGVYRVGSTVELMWKGLDEELDAKADFAGQSRNERRRRE